MRGKGFVLLISVLFTATGQLGAQDLPVTPFTSGQNWEVGAKAMGMGGAFTGIADDYSALYYNPAGLGQVEDIGFFGSFSHIMLKDRATFLGEETLEEISFTKLNGLGVTIPVPTYRGGLVFAIGYHRVRDFGGALKLVDVDATSEYAYTVENDTNIYVGDFLVTVGGEEFQEGHISQTSFGASLEIAPDVFIGGAVNFWSGFKDYSCRFSEKDLVGVPPIDTLMLPNLILDVYYIEKYSGANVTLGALLKRENTFQIGGVIKTPVTLTSNRDWDEQEREEEYLEPYYYDSDFCEYKIQSPWIFQFGGAFNVGPLMVSGDVELNDYSQIRYKTDPPEAQSGTMADANRDIRETYRSTLNYRIGGQFNLPSVGAYIRGGYGVYKSPLKDALSKQDQRFISFGASYTFTEQITLDVAYASASWEGVPNDLFDPGKVEVSKILVTLLYRM